MISGGNTREANARLGSMIINLMMSTLLPCCSLPEYSIELSIQTTNSHLAEVPVGVDDLLSLHLGLALAGEVHGAALHLLPGDGSVGQQQTTGHLVRGNILPSLHGLQIGGFTVLE